MDVAREDVEEFCLVSHEGDGTARSTAHPSSFYLSPCQIDFQISLTNSFVLATFMIHDHRTLMQVDGLVHVPSFCVWHSFVYCIAGP